MNPLLLIMGTVLLFLSMADSEPDTPHPIMWVTDDRGELGEWAYVQVDYSGEVIDSVVISHPSPDLGKKYLLVGITIANHGYYDVFTNPAHYRVEVNNVRYILDVSSYGLEHTGKTVMDTAHLGDGEQISGYLVFQIPVDATEFALIFDGRFDGDMSRREDKEVRYNNIAVKI